MFPLRFPSGYIRSNHPVIDKGNRFFLVVDKVLSVIIKFWPFPPKNGTYIRNKLFLQSFWKASYINSHADGFYPAPSARATSIFRRRPHSPPIIDPAILLLKMLFIALPRRTESDRCDYLARTATEKSIPPPLRVFSFTNGTFQWTTVVLLPPVLSATKLFLSCSFLTSYSRSTITPAPSHSTRATSFRTLSHFLSATKKLTKL